MMLEEFPLGPRASNGSAAIGAPREMDRQWSAYERAQRVAHDARLCALLSDEIKRSGFLTSAGHRAVYQKFLHSDAVDEEMTKAHDEKTQEGMFRRLMATHSQARRQSSGSVTSDSLGLRTLMSSEQARRRSCGSIFSLFSSDRSIEVDGAAEAAADHAYRVGNIAPRRPSQHEVQFAYAPDTELLEDQFSSEANEVEDDPGVPDAAAANDAVAGEKDERGRRAERRSFACTNACADSMLRALQRVQGGGGGRNERNIHFLSSR